MGMLPIWINELEIWMSELKCVPLNRVWLEIAKLQGVQVLAYDDPQTPHQGKRLDTHIVA